MVFNPKCSAIIPRDNVDLMKEDQEKQINSIHLALANNKDDVHPEFSGGVKIDVSGIVYGMEVSFNTVSAEIEVGVGVVYCGGRRGEFSSVQSLAIGSVSADDYLVASISYSNTLLRTNPVTHVNEPTYRVFSCSLAAKVLADIGADDVILGKITDITSSVPTFGDQAQWVYSFSGNVLSLFATDSAGNDLYGIDGNRRFVRFSSLTGASVTVTKNYDSSTGFAYLSVVLEKDSLGSVITTLSEVVSAINSSPYYFRAEFTGTGTDIPSLLSGLYSLYQQFVDGNDYRNNYEVVTGSAALNLAARFNTGDPYTKHLSNKGAGVPTENNPHGLSLVDLGASEISTAAHIKREHYERASLPRSVSAEFLQITFPTAVSLQAQKSLSEEDVALISGEIVGVSSNLVVSSPSLTFDLNEIYVNRGGILNRRVVASYSSASVLSSYLPIQNGSACVFSIIDKKWDLSGDKSLFLTVSSGGTVFEAKFGDDGETVDVSLEGEYLLRDLSDNTWIKIYRESEVMADGAYGNTVTFDAISDTLELPVALVFWRGSSWGYSGGSQSFIDMRGYGSLSMNNEKYLDLANQIPIEFKPLAKITSFESGSLDLTVNSFEIKYRGRLYRYAVAVTTTLDSSSTIYLCASFDARQGMTLSFINSSAYVHVADRIVLAEIITDVGEVTSSNEVYYPGSFNTADKCFEFNVSSAEEFLNVLSSIRYFPSIYTPVIHVWESFEFDMSSIVGTSARFPSVKIIGHGCTVSFTDPLVSGECFDCTGDIDGLGRLTLENLIITHDCPVFECSNSSILSSTITSTTAIPFLTSAGATFIHFSSISAISLNSYETLSVIDSSFSFGIFLYASGVLSFDGVSFTNDSGSSFITLMDEPSSKVDISINRGLFSGSNLGLISLAGSYTVALDISMDQCNINYSSVIVHTLENCRVGLNISNSFVRNISFVHGENSMLSIEQCHLYEEIGFYHSSPWPYISSYLNIDSSFVQAQLGVSNFTTIKAKNSLIATVSGGLLASLSGLTVSLDIDSCDIVTNCLDFSGDVSTNFSAVFRNSFILSKNLLFKNGTDNLKFSGCKIISCVFDAAYTDTGTRKMVFESCEMTSCSVLTDGLIPVAYLSCVVSMSANGGLCQYSRKVAVKDSTVYSTPLANKYSPFSVWVFDEDNPSVFENSSFSSVYFNCFSDADDGFNGSFSDCVFDDSNFRKLYSVGPGDEFYLDFKNCKVSLERDTEDRLFFVEAYVADSSHLDKKFKVAMDNVKLDMSVPTDTGVSVPFFGGGVIGINSTITSRVVTPHLLSDISLKNCHLNCTSSIDLLSPAMSIYGRSVLLSLLSTLNTGLSTLGTGVVGFGGFGVEVIGCKVSQNNLSSNSMVSFVNGVKQFVAGTDTYWELAIDVDKDQSEAKKPKVIFKDLVQEGGSFSFLGFNFHINLEGTVVGFLERGHPYGPEIILSDISFISIHKESLFITTSAEYKVSGGTDEGCINYLKATNINAFNVRFLRLEKIVDIIVNNCTNARFNALAISDVYTTLAASNCSSQRYQHFIDLEDRVAPFILAAFIVTNCTFKNIVPAVLTDFKYIFNDPAGTLSRKIINGCSINLLYGTDTQYFKNGDASSIINDITPLL